MLRAIQILSSSSSSPSSSFASLRFRPQTSFAFSSKSLSRRVFSTRRPRSVKPLRSHFESNSQMFSSKSSTGYALKIKFCQWCGGQTKHEIPDGEEKVRAICTACGQIAYQNPKMVVGCLIEDDNRVLLCKRKIQPSYGLWTLPAGYMEIGESAAEGAARETWEEAGAKVETLSPFAQLDIPLIGQTYIIFLAKMKEPHFEPGPESSECRLFALDEIPYDSLAFSSMLVTLKLYIEDVKAGRFKFHYGTINKRPGTSPSDIHAFTLDNHLQSRLNECN